MIEGIVVGELFTLFKKVAGKYFKPEFEENNIINRAYKAFENACEIFFKKYGKTFGNRIESFLARESVGKLTIKA